MLYWLRLLKAKFATRLVKGTVVGEALTADQKIAEAGRKLSAHADTIIVKRLAIDKLKEKRAMLQVKYELLTEEANAVLASL